MKYIDVEKLIAEIERLKDKYPSWQLKLAMSDLCDFITTYQQEQLLRKSPISWIEEVKKELQHEEELLDMRLASLKRIREKKNKFKQEQIEALEKEVEKWKNKHGVVGMDDVWLNFARHFLELGKNERKEK